MPQTRSIASIKHANKSQPLLTPPKATIATPLLNPATETGVFLCVVVPSPTCASEINRRQPKTRLSPHQASNSPLKRNHLKASLVPCRCIPSTTPRRCWTAHKNDTANRASASMTPPQHLPQSTSLKRNPPFHKHTRKSRTCRKPALSQASNTRTNHNHCLHSPKQPSQRHCSIPQQKRACFSASWCRRQPARVKSTAVSPKRAVPTPSKQQPPQKQPSKSITCPSSLRPQHDTPPLLDSAQE